MLQKHHGTSQQVAHEVLRHAATTQQTLAAKSAWLAAQESEVDLRRRMLAVDGESPLAAHGDSGREATPELSRPGGILDARAADRRRAPSKQGPRQDVSQRRGYSALRDKATVAESQIVHAARVAQNRATTAATAAAVAAAGTVERVMQKAEILEAAHTTAQTSAQRVVRRVAEKRRAISSQARSDASSLATQAQAKLNSTEVQQKGLAAFEFVSRFG